MWIQPIFSFTELVTCNQIQICSWIFSKYFQNNFLSGNCGRPLSYMNFHILRNRRLGKKCSWKLHKVHRKTPMLESLFNKIVGPRSATIFKKRLRQRVFLWILWNFKKNLRWLFLYFEIIRACSRICQCSWLKSSSSKSVQNISS